MFKDLIFIKIKGIAIPIEIKRFDSSRGLKLMGTGYYIRVTTTRSISKTKIKEILKPYREKIYTLFMTGIQEELEEQRKKDNLEIYTYIEGFPMNVFYEPITGPELTAEYDKGKGIILRIQGAVNYENVYELLDNFYLNNAKKYLPIYVEPWLKSFNSGEKIQIRVKKMLRQWGNCKKDQAIVTLNSHLIKLPSELINYIIFHELAHLVEANHGKNFYKIIDSKFPERKELDKKLKKWSFVLKDNYIEEYPGEESD